MWFPVRKAKNVCPFQRRLLARNYTNSECGEFSFSERHRTQKKPTACNKQIEHTLLTPKRIHLFYIKRNLTFFLVCLALIFVCIVFVLCSNDLWSSYLRKKSLKKISTIFHPHFICNHILWTNFKLHSSRFKAFESIFRHV